jgi:ribose transport system permease protein
MSKLEATKKLRKPGGFDVEELKSFLIRRGPLLLFGLLLIVLAAGAPSIMSATSISAILIQASPIAVVSFGLAVVVIGGGDDVVVGGIDLSIPAAAALSAAIISDQLTNQEASFVQAFAMGLLAALVIGSVNAVLVTIIGLTPILATLAVSASVVGIIRVLTTNRRINVEDPTILWIRDTALLGIPVPVVIMLLTFALFGYVVHRTRYGMKLRTVGGNLDAGLSVGLNPKILVSSTFIWGALAAGIAGVLLVARGSGMSPGLEERLLVDMVLATFVGAAFSSKNIVTVLGAMLGAVLVGFMATGLILNRVDNSWVDGWKGVLIMLVVTAAALQTRRSRQ